MKRFIMIIWVSALFWPIGLMAQKLEKKDGRYILDTEGMVAGVTRVPKTWEGIPSLDGGPLLNNTRTGTINTSGVYYKLEIAPANMDALGSFDIGGSGDILNWVDAFNLCRASTHGDATAGDWRLPTLSELMLISVFWDADDLNLSGRYWAATESSSNNSCYVTRRGNVAEIQGFMKSNRIRARCVRELP